MREFHILNLGAGVQSTTLYLMFLRGLIKPQLHYAIFADTQDEPKAVYSHLEWLQSLNGPPILTRTKGRLSDHLKAGRNSTGGRFISIPAFVKSVDGLNTGGGRRQCSNEYKIQVINQCVRREIVGLKPRQRMPKDVHIHQYYGISLDEGGRAQRIKANLATNKYLTPHFPLIENLMTRADCLTWLAKHGNVPHQVPRSACVYCPYHNDAEWLRIRENQEDWQLAVEVDEAIRVNRNLTHRQYLHKSCEPLTQIEFKPPTQRDLQIAMNFTPDCMGVCGN